MEFRVLGPLEVIGPRGSIKIGSGRQRAILALLVLRAGETVSSDRLIDEVWGDDPPSRAHRAVEVYVSGLRQAIGAEWIETHPGGYRLRSEGSEIDLARFEALVSDASRAFVAGDPRSAASAFAMALELWRGPALGDLARENAARAERARLDELRAYVLERRMDADLACGRHLEVVPELRRIVAEMPLREAFRARLMLALYRSGRQSEALETYHQARAVLDRELGVEPGRELEGLQRAILDHDPTLDLALSPPNGAEPSHPETRGERIPAVVSTTTAVVPHRRVDDATPAPGADRQGRETRRTVTTLVAQIRGPAGVDEPLDPESRRRPPSRLFEEMRQIVERHGGIATTDSGGSLTGTFGVRVVHEDDALRAVRAALEIRDSLASLSDGFEQDAGGGLVLRVGLNTGEVVANHETDVATRVTGDVASVAARLAQGAAPGDVVLARTTHQLVRWAVDVEPAGPIEKRDRSGPTTAFRLRAVMPGVGGHAQRFDTAMVGRERELGLLESAFEQAVADETCHLFTLLGPAGVGKSRLVHEFLQTVRQEALVVRGRCLPYGERVSFWPVAQTIRQLAGIEDADSTENVRERIGALLAGHQRAAAIADRVAAVLGVFDAHSTPEETLWAIRSVFERAAESSPLVIVWDDVQWGEPAFLDLIDYVAGSSHGAPILLLCIARPELLDERPAWAGGKLHATTIVLGPLSQPDVSKLLGNLLMDGTASPALERKIVEAAEGNPLFVEEFLSMLVEDGVILRVGDEWASPTDLASMATPASIMALLAARLDRLPPDERDLLEHAAVIGRVFSIEAVEALVEREAIRHVGGRIGLLARREIIRPDRSGSEDVDVFRFRHILIRDAAYAGLPKQRRVVLHERLADWLARTPQGPLNLADEVIGAHLEQAYRYRIELGPLDNRARAIGHLAAARLAGVGRRALNRGEAGVAGGLLVRAVALLPADDRDRLALLLDLSESFIERGEFAAARLTSDELIARAGAAGFEDLRWRARLSRIQLDYETGAHDLPDVDNEVARRSKVPAWRAEVRAALQFFAEAGDDLALGDAWSLVGDIAAGEGQLAEFRAAKERALEHARRAGDIRLEGRSLHAIAWADMMGPATVATAMRTADRLLEWARAAGIPSDEAIALALIGRLRAMQGEFDEARRLVDSAVAIRRDLGRPLRDAADIAAWIGMVEWLADDLVAAEEALRRGYQELEQLGAGAARSNVAGELARILYLQGRFDEAYEFAQIAETFEAAGSGTASLCAGVRGMILARRGQMSAALTLAGDAVAMAEPTGFVVYHTRALEDLAEVFELAGRPDEARLVLARANALYEKKGITVLADRARRREAALRP